MSSNKINISGISTIYLFNNSNVNFSSPLLTDDNTSTDASTPITPNNKSINRVSPEMLPNYGRNFMDKKAKTNTSIEFWNKENGEKLKKKVICLVV